MYTYIDIHTYLYTFKYIYLLDFQYIFFVLSLKSAFVWQIKYIIKKLTASVDVDCVSTIIMFCVQQNYMEKNKHNLTNKGLLFRLPTEINESISQHHKFILKTNTWFYQQFQNLYFSQILIYDFLVIKCDRFIKICRNHLNINVFFKR